MLTSISFYPFYQQRVEKLNQRGLQNEKEFPFVASFIFRTPEDLRRGSSAITIAFKIQNYSLLLFFRRYCLVAYFGNKFLREMLDLYETNSVSDLKNLWSFNLHSASLFEVCMANKAKEIL